MSNDFDRGTSYKNDGRRLPLIAFEFSHLALSVTSTYLPIYVDSLIICMDVSRSDESCANRSLFVELKCFQRFVQAFETHLPNIQGKTQYEPRIVSY
jgi:hypothetical protein